MVTTLTRVRARIDRLPAGWVLVLAGFLLQLALAVGLLARASLAGSRIAQVDAAFLTGVVVLAGVATVPSFLLLWTGRYPRAGAALAVVVALCTLVLVETYWLAWLFPLALLVAAVRVWAGAGLDAATLLDVDPDRFERVEPPLQPPEESADAGEGDPSASDDT